MRAAWSERLRILVQCDTVAGTPVLNDALVWPTGQGPSRRPVRTCAYFIYLCARAHGLGPESHDWRVWQYKRVLEYLSRYGIR